MSNIYIIDVKGIYHGVRVEDVLSFNASPQSEKEENILYDFVLELKDWDDGKGVKFLSTVVDKKTLSDFIKNMNRV